MKGLLWKDLYSVEKYIRTSLLMILFVMGMGIVVKSAEYAVMMCLFFSVSMSFTGLSADEQKNWESYALTMPVNRKQLVLEKYIFSYGIMISGFVTAVLVGGALSLIIKSKTSFFRDIGVAIGSLLIIILSIILPLALKKGVEKTRYIYLGIIIIPAMLVAFLGEQNMITIENVEFAIKWGKVLLPVAAVASVMLSYYVSVRVFEKKEL